MENAIKKLGVTDRDVAQLQAALDRVRVGQKFLERMKVQGVECDGKIDECRNQVAEAELLLAAIGDGVED